MKSIKNIILYASCILFTSPSLCMNLNAPAEEAHDNSLIMLCQNQKFSSAECLMEQFHHDPNIGRDCNGLSCLMLASLWDKPITIQNFYHHGADINAQSHDGNTALHYACLMNDIETVKMLLLLEADKAIRNHDGQTAYDFAKLIENQAIIKLLK